MQKKRQIKRFFNLVEVSLAMSVVLIGVAGVMSLLPYAMKSSTQSMRETYLADAANMIFAEIDSLVDDAQKATDSAQGAQKFANMMADGKSLNATLSNLGDYSNNTGCTVAHAVKDDYGLLRFYSVDPSQVQNSGAFAGANIRYGGTFKTDFANCFSSDYDGKIFYGLDETTPVFDVAYRIKITSVAEISGTDGELDALRDFEIDTDEEGIKYLKPVIHEMTESDEKYWRRVYVEFSWPTNREAKYRTKKVFVKEYYYNP